MNRLPSTMRYVGTLAGASLAIGMSLMLVLEAPPSAATEEAPVMARLQPQSASETLRFAPSDFDISRAVPVRIKPPEAKVATVTQVEPEAARPGRPATLVASGVNLRAGPSVNSRRLEVLDGGMAVRVLETERSWSRIVTEDGRTGWLASKFLSS